MESFNRFAQKKPQKKKPKEVDTQEIEYWTNHITDWLTSNIKQLLDFRSFSIFHRTRKEQSPTRQVPRFGVTSSSLTILPARSTIE